MADTQRRVAGDHLPAGFAATRTVTVDATPSTALVEETNAQVKRLVDECAATGVSSPKSALGDCPFSTYSSDGKATWKVVSYPQMDVTVDSWSGGLRASSQKSGSVQVTTSGSFFGPSTSTQSISIYSGKVTIGSDGSVRLQD